MIADGSITFIYSWDSMVHCSKEVIRLYVHEFARVLAAGGRGFSHHSNYGKASSRNSFKENPHWRTDMSKALFQSYCLEAGIECLEQKLIDWGDSRDLDCISTFRKRGASTD
jgi:hypothetical protein